MTLLDLGRIRLFCTSLGPDDAPALLLVHGWGGDGREWSPHAEALADRFHVLVPDLRGHGRSEVPDEGNTPTEMADDLAALIASLGVGQVVAVGHSMGVQVVNLLAIRHPSTVRSVIALDPAHGAHDAEVAEIPARLAEYRKHGAGAAASFVASAFSEQAPTGLRAAHIRTMLGTPDHVVAQAYAGMYTDPGAVGARPHSETYLRLRRQPSLTVWTFTKAAEWERGTPQVPGSRVEYWPHTGHYLHEERVERTTRLIRDWAAGATAGRQTGAIPDATTSPATSARASSLAPLETSADTRGVSE
ncbi:alpha/beta fold hydrolase [Streptomyces sp. NBC_00258]|uniref:alpha/beta fold hydrolase n=1 Tax=Streptomyces sp. NBC_00258 TaxID=2903642 RepID=UPI002E2834F3|nr:alpha/beta hydrolase [Streptomyces sp. NBC_00258]